MPQPRTAELELLYELVQPLEITPLPAVEGVWIGDDTGQLNGSFKIRGSLYALQRALSHDQNALEHGVFCPSAGNAGQGAALAATYLGATAHVFMPSSAPPSKVAAVEQFGGTVTPVAGTVDDAIREAQTACRAKGGFFLHPFDDADVIDGQASLGYEIADSNYDFDTVFVPVGGGGLLAGVCKALATRQAATQVFGVQLEDCDAFSQSIAAGCPIELDDISTLADGTAVKRAGVLTLQAVLGNPNFGGMITVTNQELGCALLELDTLTSLRAETAAGLSFAGVRRYLQTAPLGGRHLAVITGKHRDPTRFEQLIAA